MKTLKIITTLSALTVFAGGVNAASPAPGGEAAHGPRGPRIIFEQVDANGDGVLTAQEFADHRANMFAKRDQNSDGILTADEMKTASLKKASAQIDARIARLIKQRDANGDGAISLAELPGEVRFEKMIARLDTDGDGAISKDEMAAARKNFRSGAKRPANQ